MTVLCVLARDNFIIEFIGANIINRNSLSECIYTSIGSQMANVDCIENFFLDSFHFNGCFVFLFDILIELLYS